MTVCTELYPGLLKSLDRQALLGHLVEFHKFLLPDQRSSNIPKKILDNKLWGKNCWPSYLVTVCAGHCGMASSTTHVCLPRWSVVGIQETKGNNGTNYCKWPDKRLWETSTQRYRPGYFQNQGTVFCQRNFLYMRVCILHYP